MTARTVHSGILRAYDVRGIFGDTLFTEDARAIGRAFATRMAADGARTVCVGCDGRLSTPELEIALTEGLQASGADVIRIGRGPTPMLSFAIHHLEADGGVMVTGSHNPPDHNGFKMTLSGKPVFGNEIQVLGRICESGDYAAGSGTVREESVSDAYVARLVRDAEVPDGLVAAWDTGNGSAGEVLVSMTDALAGRHLLLNERIDGTFPAHHPDPTVEANFDQLRGAVAGNGCGVGFAFDGDGDRIGMIDGKGRILWGDQIVALIARDVLAGRPGATVIADVKASDLLFDEVARLGGRPLIWNVGHSLIKAKMAETGSPLAGEMSGHIFIADEYYGFDDALYAAVRMLRVLARTGKTLDALYDELPVMVNTPELRFECADERKFAVIDEVRARLRDDGADIFDLDGVRVSTPGGWWLLRASNTQAALVARCEGRDQASLEALKSELVRQLRASGIEPPGF